MATGTVQTFYADTAALGDAMIAGSVKCIRH
jgi:hypothetical protein